MYSLLLSIIYISFISLGLPDSLLGAAWPVMQGQLQVPMSYAGIVTMIISGGTIIASLMSHWVTRTLGPGAVTAISVLLTAVALLGFSQSHTFLILCLWAIPYGLGAGAVDAALNNYVALHYTGRHMSWLHCFWGVGAAVSPAIMSYCLMGGFGWHSGYAWVGGIQLTLAAILFISLPLWKRNPAIKKTASAPSASMGLIQAWKIRGGKDIFIIFFCYAALENTTGLWASTYLVGSRSLEPVLAAHFAALFYLGITLGRFLCGFIADKLGDRLLIRLGLVTCVFGLLLVGLSGPNKLALIGLSVIGLGCAPVYPCLLHSTPVNFGREYSQAMIGIQMASGHIGATVMPFAFGLLAENYGIGLYPLYLLCFALFMLLMFERLNRITGKN